MHPVSKCSARRAGTALVLLLLLSAATPARAMVERHGPGAANDWVEYHDATRSQHAAKVTTLDPTHRLISLNLSGTADNPRYAAVWVRGSAAQALTPATTCCTEGQLALALVTNAVLGYQPVAIAATGGTGDGALYAAVFEPGHGEITVATALAKGALKDRNDVELAAHRILRSVDVFGTDDKPLYAGVWEKVTVPGAVGTLYPSWSADVAVSAADWNVDLQEHRDAGERPGVLAPGVEGNFTTAWYESLFGDWDAVIGLTPGDLGSAITDRPDLFPMQVQCGNGRCAALFADPDDVRAFPERRVTGMTGLATAAPGPDSGSWAIAAFDLQVTHYMQEHGLRSAAAAITYKGRLVHVRAFTWAEPGTGYVTITPAEKFGIGSLTKMFTAATAYLLDEQGVLSLTDLMVAELGLPASLPDDARANQIRLGDLLAHRSGFKHWPADADTVANAYGISPPIPAIAQILYNLANDDGTDGDGCPTPDEAVEPYETDLCATPRTAYGYTNLAYQYAAEVMKAELGAGSFQEILVNVLFPGLYASAPAQQPNITSSDTWADNGAAGSLRATAPQVAKLVAAFGLPADRVGPLAPATVTAMLHPLDLITSVGLAFQDGTHTNGGLIRDTGGCGTGFTVYAKGGSTDSYKAHAVMRADGAGIVLLVHGGHAADACDLVTWLSGASFDYFGTMDLFPTYGIPSFPSK